MSVKIYESMKEYRDDACQEAFERGLAKSMKINKEFIDELKKRSKK